MFGWRKAEGIKQAGEVPAREEALEPARHRFIAS